MLSNGTVILLGKQCNTVLWCDDGATQQCLLLQMYESTMHGCHLAAQDM